MYDKVQRNAETLKQDKDSMATANERVAEIMLKVGKETVKHGGLTFHVKEPKEVRPKVVVKKD